MSAVKKYRYPLGICAIIIALVLVKLPFLGLPYYWDEAWPYGTAVHMLYDHGLSLIPGAIPNELSRGHPLMFHFLASGWMKIFGPGLYGGHTFALFVSILTLLAVYKFGKDFFSERAGFVAALLFAAQSVFIAESVFLMPEMLMALWTLLCFYTYFKGNKLLFVFTALAMLLTKESGVVFIGTLFFAEVLRALTDKERNFKKLAGTLALITTPALIASLNFLYNKVMFGWFLFPLHLELLSSGLSNFTEKLITAVTYLAVSHGRNGLSLFVIIALVLMLFVRKLKFSANEKRILPVLGYFIVFFLVFCALNCFIERYTISAFPPFIIIAAVLLDKAFTRYKIVYPLIIAGLTITGVYFYVDDRQNHDDTDYSPSIKVDMKVVAFCENEHLTDASIFAPSVLSIDLKEPYAGYLKGKPFSNVHPDLSAGTEYVIFSSDEYYEEEISRIKREHHLTLVQRFESRYAWRELYKVDK